MKFQLGGLLLASTILAIGGDARACGGCFHEPTPVGLDSVVTGHRMVFAVSRDRTVLWDQIKYTGNPSEFGWVLPVNPGAYLEVSTDAWFEALDAVTTVTVTAPPLRCVSSASSGVGCAMGSSDTNSASIGGTNYLDGNQVQVLHEGTVGPYQTVTLSSTDGSALRTWLGDHGYVVEPEIDPVIDSYVAEGADFIAVRLIPGQGVSSMTPVRVITPGGPAMLPLRMVAAGTGAFVDIVLYVIGEGRYLLKDFKETRVDLANLTYDFQQTKTNYETLRENALGQNDGYSFLTAFASATPFARQQTSYSVGGGYLYQSLGDLYFGQAVYEDGVMPSCPSIDGKLGSSALVGDGTSGTLAASDFACSVTSASGSPLTYTDISTALTGLHPNAVWLARLEMNLPHEALSADCTVGLSPTQSAVSKDLTAVKITGRPAYCAEPVFLSSVVPSGSAAHTFAWGVFGFAALSLLRRRRDLGR